MNFGLCLRLLTEADLAFADSLRDRVGWNQTRADWQRMRALEPTGCFLAECNGVPVGTATTIRYGLELAWIGMVLVHPEYRRRGVGRALLERCLAYLRACGVRCIKLDATPAGKTVYDGLGFKEEWTLTRWTHAHVPPIQAKAVSGMRSWQTADGLGIEPVELAAFGVSRQRLVQVLAPQSQDSVVVESEPGQITGYGLLRPGSRAFYLGPVAAVGAETALPVIEALMTSCEGNAVYWDIPDQNSVTVEWAKQHGFTAQRPLIRMYLGENHAPGDPRKQYALTGPETG